MKKRMSEWISLGFVYTSAAATIFVLVFILGYIIFNGFFYSNRYEYAVTSHTSSQMDEMAVVVHKKINLNEIPYDILRDIYTDTYINWKKIASSPAEMVPIIDTRLVAQAEPYFGKLGELVEYGETGQEVLQRVSLTPGAIGIVSISDYEHYKKESANAKRLTLRLEALLCNPDVTALHGNFKIGSINESDIKKLQDGSITNWKELGGTDMPVVYMPFKIDLHDTAEIGLFCAKLKNTVGAFTLAPAAFADRYELSSIRLARNERGLNLKPEFIYQKPVDSGRMGGISTIIANTFIMIVLTMLFAIPPGLFAAIYLVEYAKEGRLVRLLRLGTETLAGIPSIIFGLFGMLVFVQGFGWGISLLSGCMTLTLMILPTIVRTTEEALKSVSPSLKEGSYALGATKMQSVFKVVLPAAFPAISAGVILAIGRALGETAALIYTMGSNYNLTDGLLDSTRTLAVHLYLIIAEGISTDRAFAAGTVLIFFIFIINTASKRLISRVGRMGR